MFMPFSSLSKELDTRSEQGLLRSRRTLDTPQSPHIVVDGKPYLAFCSNDYLGLANHPQLIAALQQGAQEWGVGAGAAHLVSGHFAPHHQLEQQLAAFVGKPAALLFSTGYMANLGTVQALVGKGDSVFADKLNHASLNDAMLLSRAEIKRYRHGDMAQLAQLLAQTHSGRKLIITDAVFSMDGDIAPLRELLALCEQHDAWLYVDDAHGFGVLGEQGRGSLAHFGIASPRIIYMATLGKAAGVSGAFVAAEQAVIDTLVNHAHSYVYTTATPPALIGRVVTKPAFDRARRRIARPSAETCYAVAQRFVGSAVATDAVRNRNSAAADRRQPASPEIERRLARTRYLGRRDTSAYCAAGHGAAAHHAIGSA